MTEQAERHIVFVVAGYAAIGMGHFYRALMLAREFAQHRVSFLCTRESDPEALALLRDYPVFVQQQDLATDVLALDPDLVINDFLNTEAAYISRLTHGPDAPAVVNFEDEGPGADLADLVVNALYESRDKDCPHDRKPEAPSRRLCGHECFCLRDEFILATRNPFRSDARKLLLTFGGTDSNDFTRQCLEVVRQPCLEQGILIRVVAGPGYAHKQALQDRIAVLNGETPFISYTHTTNVMSREMEQADMALCSAGRTVYELTHMRIPAIVLAHHEREDMHTFARPENGFIYLGVMRDFRAGDLAEAFAQLLLPEQRRILHERQSRFDFTPNKAQVIRRILRLL